MKYFIKQVAFFILFCIAANFFLNRLFPLNGNEYYKAKYDFLEKETDNKYNVFFIGSSRIYRHVVPNVFDSCCTAISLCKSFNLGSPGAAPPESYSLCEKFLKDYQKSKVNYVFLELAPILPIDRQNLFAKQSYYWLDWDYTVLSAKYFFYKDQTSAENLKAIFNYILCFFQKEIGFNYLSGIGENKNEHFLGKRKDGYYSLEAERDFISLNDKTGKNGIADRREEFLKDTNQLCERCSDAGFPFSKSDFPKKDFYSAEYVMLNHLLEIAKEKNIHLTFIIPPRLGKTDYEEVLFLKNLLPKSSVLEIANPNEYPELWTVNRSFDIGHLNEPGAKKFTQLLAEKCNTLLQ